jgi:hypothetical protein
VIGDPGLCYILHHITLVLRTELPCQLQDFLGVSPVIVARLGLYSSVNGSFASDCAGLEMLGVVAEELGGTPCDTLTVL